MERKAIITFLTITTVGIITTGLLSLNFFKVAISQDLTVQVESEILRYSLVSIISGILVSIALGIRYVKKMIEPLKHLAKITKKISTGNYQQRIYSSTQGEIQELSQNFNTMSENLELAVSELQDNNTKMKSILTSMLNGVIAIDNENKIMLVNTVAENIFKINYEDIKGKHILDIIKDEKLNRIFKRLIDKRKIADNEIEVYLAQQKIISLKSNFIRVENDPNRIIGLVLILQDITEIKKLENMRKDFVANVSHELKTPLTSIKGFIETLQSSDSLDSQTRTRFLNILEIETDRLTYLIQDLLILSEIENKNKVVEEKINIEQNISQIMNVLNQLAIKKNITIDVDINENTPDIYGNSGWFKQMLINLIENAIKYTEQDGDVRVLVNSDKENVLIEISDTGIGIDIEHFERLFERFYRIDKSRTRQIGGTGLGLAIVKHIVRSFNGEINIKSQVNKGTNFYITLPLDKYKY